MTKKNEKEKSPTDDDPGLQLLYEHIRRQFVNNAEAISKSEKPERLLKMIQTCKELQPVNSSNKELWKLIQKVRTEVMGAKPTPRRKATSRPAKKKVG